MDRILGFQNVESMRKTMLLQEQMFKHQVRELHRIYNVQKKLMDELEQGLIRKTGVEEGHFRAFITGNDAKETSSSCSGEMSRMPIKFDLESRCNSTPSSIHHRDSKGIDEETDVEVELTLSIGRHCTRKQRSSSRSVHDPEFIGEHSSSSMGTSKVKQRGNQPGSNISSSTRFQDSKQPHWLLQDLSLDRT